MLWYPRFNPRSHEGSDDLDVSSGSFRERFNPRSHEGSDDKIRLCKYKGYSFNPRSHEGSDRLGPLPDSLCPVSIHAPTKGATFSMDMV